MTIRIVTISFISNLYEDNPLKSKKCFVVRTHSMLIVFTNILSDGHPLQKLETFQRNYKHPIGGFFHFGIVFTLIIMCRNLYQLKANHCHGNSYRYCQPQCFTKKKFLVQLQCFTKINF